MIDLTLDYLRRAKAVMDKQGIPCNSPWVYLNESMAKHFCSELGIPYKPSLSGVLKAGDYAVMIHELQP